ncbi:MAG: hypothetical protein EOO77_21550 [Oxalobacteraceae bacterium]|nr:MAG: hypothetical protein EOO77_21550 [Oxalobacteraceae bacterium]
MTRDLQPFAPAIIRCMGQDIGPSQADIDEVAAHIWSEIAPGEASWHELVIHSGTRSGILRYARAALGLTQTGL